MIGYLKGKVIHSTEAKLIIETASGVGYEIYFRGIIGAGQIAGVYISHQFKETGQELYGFLTIDEKNCFESLLTVKGVGPKLAFSILKSLSINEIYSAIFSKDQKIFKSVSGVGNKVAAQIILDLSGKVLDFSQIELKKTTINAPVTEIKGSDALMALKNLGLNEEKVLPLVQNILKNNASIESSEEIVKIVLKNLHQ